MKSVENHSYFKLLNHSHTAESEIAKEISLTTVFYCKLELKLNCCRAKFIQLIASLFMILPRIDLTKPKTLVPE